MSFWRVRMMYSPSRSDFTREAWEAGVIGIWYGAWTPGDLEMVDEYDPVRAAAILSKLPAQRKLGWPMKSHYVSYARKFRSIGKDDWVFVYFGQVIHLGRVSPGLLSKPIQRFEQGGEFFKAKSVRACKSFRLSELPEAFRLLACAGRATVHHVPATERFISMLADSDNPRDVWHRMKDLDWEGWLDSLGPKGWESLCLGYLIQEEGYLPTGLGIGGTLPDFDLVGRGRNGRPIFAQCKKGNTIHTVGESEFEAYRNSIGADIYLFAYGGAKNVPPGVHVVTGEKFRNWINDSPNGKRYRELLTGA